MDAMKEEIDAIERNDTWSLISLPKGQKSIGVKWVYKLKKNVEGGVNKFKARLVVKGYKQKQGIDYEKVFAPIAKFDIIRLIFFIAAMNRWQIHQLDVKSAFLNGVLEEEVYVDQPEDQPEGFIVKGKEHMMYRLKKALYGLKQAPRAWNLCIDKHFGEEGFTKCPYEHGVYMKIYLNDNKLIICLYVDDLLITCDDEQMIVDFKSTIFRRFDMTDVGLMSLFLGIEVHQKDDGIWICQKRYAKELLEKFRMNHCNSVSTSMQTGVHFTKEGEGKLVDSTLYKSLIESLRYLTVTRPDIMYSVAILSRFMENPRESHWLAAKRILRYISGTFEFGLHYQCSGDMRLLGYCDSDWANDHEERKSTSGYVFYVGSTAFTWCTHKQKVVALSTCEAEYIAAAAAACEAIWLKNLLKEFFRKIDEATIIYVDNKSAIALAKNPVQHGRSKHIDVRYHFIRDAVLMGYISIEHCSTEDQVADLFTKALSTPRFLKLLKMLGMKKVLV
ncbi:hypothetical protein KFK09_011309 [Dendrobium nobile]|uniref:Reverse transcriptase Ty1/copia-type domain-containing protein n=1 Tax=Dendrobium nobile TaxID=94219 RepID=A0A8T3BEK9_DENNO|nr:hypothetical protein KFK09_011309 [Dendrobium nobile]